MRFIAGSHHSTGAAATAGFRRRAAKCWRSFGPRAAGRMLFDGPRDHNAVAYVPLIACGRDPMVPGRRSLGLANLDPSLSAKAGASPAQCAFAMAATSAASFAFCLTPEPALAFVSLAMTCFFLASIWLRLFAGAASTAGGREPYRPRVEDRRLPVYSIVVALHREARVVPQLIAALDAIDYPRSKLDIKLVIEHDDDATRHAIEALHLPATYEIVVAPAGWPRTKPRALNIALPLVRGELLVVFDAEDAPAPGQLREAAERFLRSPRELCLPSGAARDRQYRGFLANPALRHRVCRFVRCVEPWPC